MANTLLAGAGSKGHAEGTTQSAVAEGTIVVRDQASQQQSLADLSRDPEHANDSISPIFNKQKEQKRLQTAQMIAEIGVQVADIARTQGALSGLDTGTGSEVQRSIQALTAALQGLAGGDVVGALAGASAPELAHLLKGTESDPLSNTLAHALLGGVVASLQGNNAAAGALGAASGELAAKAIMAALYPGKTAGELSESEKQTVSMLATVSAGIAGGLAGGNTAGTVTGAQAGKNAVENNYLSSKQIDAWSAEMKACQARGGDCNGIIKKYEELSTAQQHQLINDCATSPATCQQKYGNVLADSMAVKQAIDRAIGEDIPIKMVYDLTATWAHQMDADGIVASNQVSERIMAKYGLDQAQADIIAGVALSALGGVSKAGKGSALPTPNATIASNGLVYKSNPKHTAGQLGNRTNAGIEPQDSLK